MTRYSIEPKTRKYVKGYEFLSFARDLSKNYRKQLLGTKLDVLKTAPKKVVHKSAEVTGEFIGNKVADNIVKAKPAIDGNSRNVKEITIPPAKRVEILIELR